MGMAWRAFGGGELSRRCRKIGLKIVSYCVGAELLVPADQQRQVVERLRLEVDVAGELGVKTMRHDVTRGFGENAKKLRIPKTFDAAVKYVVPAIRDVADYGAPRASKPRWKTTDFSCRNRSASRS